MTTLRYGDELLSLYPDNGIGLISAETGRDMVVSQRSGGAQALQTGTDFTVTITNGVPVSINPLLPDPSVSGTLWAGDGNHRLYPNYAAAIPSLTIPAGYAKLVQCFVSLNCDKQGSQEDDYIFQLDNDGTPFGEGVTIALDTEATTITLLVNASVVLSDSPLIGMTVTGDGTGDDIVIHAFEMFIIDFQLWTAP